MTRSRTEFPEAVKRAALERAGHRCQDKLCGRSDEWLRLWPELSAAGVNVAVLYGQGAPLGDLIRLRDAIMSARFKHPRALKPIIRRFKLDGCDSLLEVDHEREDVDGGAATLDNALVRCVFCHLFKTLERGKRRRKGPQKKQPEQLDLVHRTKVEGLRQIMKLKPGDKITQADWTGMTYDPALHRVISMPEPSLLPDPALNLTKPERRHFSEAQFTEAAQKRERAADEWPWGA